MTELCQCGHEKAEHNAGYGICFVVNDGYDCPCLRFTPPVDERDGESREEFERDRLGQTGSDNTVKFAVDEREKAFAMLMRKADDMQSGFTRQDEGLVRLGFDAGWNARDSEIERLKGEIADLKIRVLVDWFEDFADEDNGNYQHLCPDCNIVYYGHKRRIGPCKQCWTKFATTVVIEHNRRALEEK